MPVTRSNSSGKPVPPSVGATKRSSKPAQKTGTSEPPRRQPRKGKGNVSEDPQEIPAAQSSGKPPPKPRYAGKKKLAKAPSPSQDGPASDSASATNGIAQPVAQEGRTEGELQSDTHGQGSRATGAATANTSALPKSPMLPHATNSPGPRSGLPSQDTSPHSSAPRPTHQETNINTSLDSATASAPSDLAAIENNEIATQAAEPLDRQSPPASAHSLPQVLDDSAGGDEIAIQAAEPLDRQSPPASARSLPQVLDDSAGDAGVSKDGGAQPVSEAKMSDPSAAKASTPALDRLRPRATMLKKKATERTTLDDDASGNESQESGSDFEETDALYKRHRKQRGYNPKEFGSSDELDEEEDLEMEDDAMPESENGEGVARKSRRPPAKGKKSTANLKEIPAVQDDGDDTRDNSSSDESDHEIDGKNGRKGRISKKVLAQATGFWDKFLGELDELALESGHARDTLLLKPGAAKKNHRSDSPWNAFSGLYAAEHKKPKDVSAAVWIKETVKPAYAELFKDCDDSASGVKTRRKIKKDLLARKKESDKEMFKKYAKSGKKFRLIQKIAAKMEEEAQYAHNVCGVEVFGIVYEPGYGDIDATAANTMFTGSAEMAAVLADKKVAGKALIGEIQALVGVKICQDDLKKKGKAKHGPANRDEWRHEVSQKFHDIFYPEDTGGSRRVPWTKLGLWLYTHEKHLLRWPSHLPIPAQGWDLNGLTLEDLKLLCKSDAELEDWADDERPDGTEDASQLILISLGSGRTLLTLGEVAQWRDRNTKRNKRAAARGKKSLVPSSIPNEREDDNENARIDTNDRFRSLSPPVSRARSPTETTLGSKNKRARDHHDEEGEGAAAKRPRVGPESSGGGEGSGTHESVAGSSTGTPAASTGSSTPAIYSVNVNGVTQRFVLVGSQMMAIAK